MHKKKLTEFDILRSISFFAVVLQHILGAYTIRSSQEINKLSAVMINFELVRFAVPMFVFIFGVMLFYNNSNDFNYFLYLHKRSKQLLVPYLIWTFIYLLYYAVINRGFRNIFIKLLPAILMGSGSYHLWYVPFIFQFVLLTPFFLLTVSYLKSNINTKKNWFLFFGFLLCICLAYLKFTPRLYNIPFLGGIFFTYRSRFFASYFLFFSLGILCGSCYQTFKRWSLRLLPITALIYFISIVLAVHYDVSYIKIHHAASFNTISFLDPLYAVFTLCAIITLFGFASLCAEHIEKLNKFWAFISKYSYEAYLNHALILSIVSLILFHLSGKSSATIIYILIAVLTPVLSLSISYLTERMTQFLRKGIQKYKNRKSIPITYVNT